MAQPRIRFYDANMEPRRIDVRCQTIAADGEEAVYDLWFELSDELDVTWTSLAVALSTLCGRAYQHIHYDFPIADEALATIREFTLANVVARGSEPHQSTARDGTLLSFSGGFDSLAARALMPENTRLVSMDFGGRFARERAFFERFDTLRVSTNIVDTPLRRNSWSFMGIGAILAADYYHAAFHTFGGIMQAGPDGLRLNPVAARNNTFPPFRAAGYTNAPYVLGLSEIGALAVLIQTTPGLVSDSLVSLASPGEEKLYRKAALVRLVADLIGVEVDLPEVARPKRPRFAFGERFSLDVLALYAISKTGADDALGLVRDIPASVIEAARSISPVYLERANTTLYEHFPRALAAGLHQRLWECGISWYTEADWQALAATRELLAPYHPQVQGRPSPASTPPVRTTVATGRVSDEERCSCTICADQVTNAYAHY